MDLDQELPVEGEHLAADGDQPLVLLCTLDVHTCLDVLLLVGLGDALDLGLQCIVLKLILD